MDFNWYFVFRDISIDELWNLWYFLSIYLSDYKMSVLILYVTQNDAQNVFYKTNRWTFLSIMTGPLFIIFFSFIFCLFFIIIIIFCLLIFIWICVLWTYRFWVMQQWLSHASLILLVFYEQLFELLSNESLNLYDFFKTSFQKCFKNYPWY